MNNNTKRLNKFLSKNRKTGKPIDSSLNNPNRKSSRKKYKFDGPTLTEQKEIYFGGV